MQITCLRCLDGYYLNNDGCTRNTGLQAWAIVVIVISVIGIFGAIGKYLFIL